MLQITEPHISIVIPVFKAEKCLIELHDRLKESLEKITQHFEIILIEDRGGDKSWFMINQLAAQDPRVRGIQLSRNFGQHHAITAGLDFAKGDWVVVMDCDLQDQPEEIVKLYNKALDGYDVVVGRRVNRQDNFYKKLGSSIFSMILGFFSDAKIDNKVSNFGIYSKKVIQNIISLKEQNRSFGLFALWVGFNRTELDIEHAARPYGKSSYSFQRLIKLAISSLVAHSNKLLYLSILLGFIFSISSVFYALWLIFKYFTASAVVAGWTSVMVSIYFTTGLIFGSIGIVGLYIGKIFDEVKGRPIYIIDSTTFEMKSHNE